MTEGTQPQSATELPQETLEVIETREQLDRATTDPEAEMERTADFKQAEDVQEAFVDSVPLVQEAETVKPTESSEVPPPPAPENEVVSPSHVTSRPSATQISTAQKADEVHSEIKLAAEKDTMTKPEGAPAKTDAGSEIEIRPGMVSLIPEDRPENPFSELAAEADIKGTEGITEGERTQAVNKNIEKVVPAEQNADTVDQQDAAMDEVLESPTLPDVEAPNLQRDIPQQPAVEGAQKVDHFTSTMGVAKDETGDFRVSGLHGDGGEIEPPDAPTATNRDVPVWGDGPAPPGFLNRANADDTVSKDRVEDAEEIPADESSESDSDLAVGARFSVDESPAGLRKYGKDTAFTISDLLESGESSKVSLEDLVLSVMPWPYHKDLPEPLESSGDNPSGMASSLSIPLVSLLSLIILIEVLKHTSEEDSDNEEKLTALEAYLDNINDSSIEDPELRDQLQSKIEQLVEDIYNQDNPDQETGVRDPDDQNNEIRKPSLGDLVLSVSPWPYHKDLPVTGNDSNQDRPIPPMDYHNVLTKDLFRWINYIDIDSSLDDSDGEKKEDDE